MSAIENAPEWACRVFCERANLNYDAILVSTNDQAPALRSAIRAGGLLISKHEEAPVDPCVVEGRKLVAETQHDWPESPWHVGEAAETIAGNRDYTLVVKAAIEGVRRGIELGKSS